MQHTIIIDSRHLGLFEKTRKHMLYVKSKNVYVEMLYFFGVALRAFEVSIIKKITDCLSATRLHRLGFLSIIARRNVIFLLYTYFKYLLYSAIFLASSPANVIVSPFCFPKKMHSANSSGFCCQGCLFEWYLQDAGESIRGFALTLQNTTLASVIQ